MNAVSLQRYEQLKQRILGNAGIDHILPAECKVLSNTIFKKTGCRISETTLKRIYGFAHTKFLPSTFTIDVLAKYCDYESWDDFCDRENQRLLKPLAKDLDWQQLQQNAHKITGFTLQALKNKSGIPYNQTIQRGFIDEHLNEFLNSGCTATLLAAPAGYGKTIGLCHWVDDKIASDTDDIVLLFSSNALMSVLLSGRDINDWMLALLGYSDGNDINVLLGVKQKGNSKFYLIVDGFDEFMFKNDQFRLILNQLIDILSLYRSQECFKLILTSRSTTWVNNRHELDINEKTWFTRFVKDDGYINVPLFSIEEIKILTHKINPKIKISLADDAAETFNHPLYFQFYYKRHKDNFSLNEVDRLSIYDLISTFILNKVYLGHHSAEKLLFIKKLVEELDVKNNQHQINRLKVNNLIRQYQPAYQELLSTGFLREFNESDNYHYNTYIVFGNDNFLEHSISKMLLYDNGNLFDEDLIKKINTILADSPRKVKVLKWCLVHAIKTGQLKNIEQLINAHLISNEKLEIIIFLGELLEKEYSSAKNNSALIQYFKQPFSEKIFNYFFGLELINPDYKRTLNILLKFEFPNRKKILIHITLGIIAAIQLDLNELEACLLKLKGFPKAEYDFFEINPLNCLDAIYYHIKYGIIKKEALIALTKLSFNSFNGKRTFYDSAANDLMYLLGLYTIMLCNNPNKRLRFINFLKTSYKNDDFGDHATQYGFFLKILAADAYYELGNEAMVSELYYTIAEAYKKSENLLTPYMQILFHNLKVKTLINTQREDLIAAEMKDINYIADECGYKFPKLYLFVLLLKSPSINKSAPGLYKEVYHEFIKMQRENGLNPQIFIKQNEIKKT